MAYFGEPVGRVKMQTKRLIRDLLSNTPNCYVRGGELGEYLFRGECVTEVCEAERNWRGKSGVQIPRDICTRFGRYLYSTKCSWIIKQESVCFVPFPKRSPKIEGVFGEFLSKARY